MTKKFPVLVTSADQVRANVATFAAAVEKFADLQSRLSNARAWYAAQDRNGRWQFAPSKWAGYLGMTATDYVDNARDNMDGRQTENRLIQWFKPLGRGSQPHNDLLKELAAFTSRYGKQPSAACRIAVVEDRMDAGQQMDDLTDLIVRIARRLDVKQRRYIREALRD